MSWVTADFVSFAQSASSQDDVECVARMHAVLSDLLPQLEGKPWTRCLEDVIATPWRPRPPPRGQA
jgi:hypothetical protein